MKKVILLLAIVNLLFSCNSEEQTELSNEEFSSSELIGAKVAYKNEVGEVVLGVKQDELLNSFNKFSKKVKLNKKAKSFKVMEIHDKEYIRFFNEDGSVSTIALLYSSNKFKESFSQSKSPHKLMYVGETVCTTEDCSACCGCVPDGNYCTNCELNAMDCKRTTSGG